MTATIRRVEYFHATVRDEPGAAYHTLTRLAGAEVNLLAFHAVPVGPDLTQLTLFPDNVERLARAAESIPLDLTGPYRAFLIQGDDHLGALVDHHRRLSDAGIGVFASSGVADGRGGYGYVLYVRGEDVEGASTVLGL